MRNRPLSCFFIFAAGVFGGGAWDLLANPYDNLANAASWVTLGSIGFFGWSFAALALMCCALAGLLAFAKGR